MDNFILYNNFDEKKIIKEVLEEKANKTKSIAYLVKLAEENGFYGNLWHVFLAFSIVNDVNVYSKTCEIEGKPQGSVNDIAMHDFAKFKDLFDIDVHELGMELVTYYENPNYNKKLVSKRIRDKICTLATELAKAKTVHEFKDIVTAFYAENGVGKFGLHKAFRLDGCEIIPVTNISDITLEDLVGYDIPKQKLIDNTEAFVNGRKANNCLLFGDAGTGKSSSVKAILNRYYDKGLRVIEIYKHQFHDINNVLAQVKNRNYKFIIFMDDLSFDDTEFEYKYLKAVIEGGLEKRPDNVLIYATSNRRHLIKESFADKEGRRFDDMHASDTVEEKLSLAARFGQSIYFVGPSKKEYDEIVRVLAKRNNINIEESELLLLANKWELSHSGRSGRSAKQFIDHLLSLGY